jgi:hypothetical protein
VVVQFEPSATRPPWPRNSRDTEIRSRLATCCAAVGNGPADDQPGIGVNDRGAVHLSLGAGMFGDVGDPQPVRGVDGELAVDQVVARLGGRVADRAALSSAPVEALNPASRISRATA